MAAIPAGLADWKLALNGQGMELEYTFDAHEKRTGIPALLRRLSELGIEFKDLQTRQSSLEDIFVSLVHGAPSPQGSPTSWGFGPEGRGEGR